MITFLEYNKAQHKNAIRLRNNEDILFWTKQFGCSAIQLGKAIIAVGYSREALENYLKK